MGEIDQGFLNCGLGITGQGLRLTVSCYPQGHKNICWGHQDHLSGTLPQQDILIKKMMIKYNRLLRDEKCFLLGVI